jgi:hypothetical protein
MQELEAASWQVDWVWSLPLIVLTVVIQVAGMGAMRRGADRLLPESGGHWRLRYLAAVVLVSLSSTLLLGFAAAIWAVVYVLVGALPDARPAMLYSLSALTSYGHAAVFLQPRWQLMGALEALNGVILFGLTTAFLFSIIHGARLRPGL